MLRAFPLIPNPLASGEMVSASRCVPVSSSCLLLAALGACVHAGTIEYEDFGVRPESIATGAAFEIHARVLAQGVSIVSMVVRTTESIPKDDAPPGFELYQPTRKLAYLAHEGDLNLRDNGPRDLDPAARAFRIRISTKGWEPGAYKLSVFAHNRPGPGSHIAAERRLLVRVDKERTRIQDLGGAPEVRLPRCEVIPPVADAGEPVTLHVRAEGADECDVRIRSPYFVHPDHVPPGVTYDPETRMAYVPGAEDDVLHDNGPKDADPNDAALAIRFDTTDWRPGLVHLEVTPTMASGGRPDIRNVAIKIRSPKDRLDVKVSESWPMCPGTHAERLVRLADGTLVHGSYYSTDNGQTWTKRKTGTIGVGPKQLRDGRVLSLDYRTLPIEGRSGWYRGKRYVSSDNGRTVDGPLAAEFHVPLAKAAHGHAFHPGPLYMRSMVERPDGRLVALMAGWFLGDDVPCPHSPRRPYSRTYTCESHDGGKTWAYLSTIGYGQIGSEGYNEGAMQALPDGRLFAVLRTGSMRDKRCQDNPIMQSYSDDGGRRWTTPTRTGVMGAFPHLIVLSDGMLAASYGRPGACIMFSHDLGTTWTDHTVVDTTPYSGYTSIAEIKPGEILMAFGTKGYRDPKTAERSNRIRLATIRYREKGSAKPPDPLARLRLGVHEVQPLGDGFYECEVRSRCLERTERFCLHLPSGYDPARPTPYAMIVLLHGSGRSHRSLIDHAEARAALAASPDVILLPHGGGSWWVDSPVDAKSRYQSYVLELIALADRCLHVSPHPRQRSVCGWSMGGFGAANLVANHPQWFGALGILVGLLDFPNPAYTKEHNHAIPAVLGESKDWPKANPLAKAAALRGKAILLITGEDAFDRKMNETFSRKLRDLEIDHDLSVQPGGHTLDLVVDALPQALEFLHAAMHPRE